MENDRNGRERSMAATNGGTTPQPPAAPTPPAPGSGSDAAKCTIVEACSCPLPPLAAGGKTSVKDLLAKEPFSSGHLKLRVLYAARGVLHDAPAESLHRPERWVALSYAPGHATPGVSGSNRLLIEREFCPEGGTIATTGDGKEGVLPVLAKPIGGPSEILRSEWLLRALAALAGLLAGYLAWGR